MEKEFNYGWIKAMFASMLLSSCTISMNMVHTEGTATDLIDETQSPTNTTTPTVSIPVSGI